METPVPPSRVKYPRHLHLSGNPHLRQWSYLKHRKNPAGVLGRPRSPIPAKERAKQARARYQAALRERGMTPLRTWLPGASLEALRAEARATGRSLGEIIRARLAPTLPPLDAPGLPPAPLDTGTAAGGEEPH